jgi:hypothetical protein
MLVFKELLTSFKARCSIITRTIVGEAIVVTKFPVGPANVFGTIVVTATADIAILQEKL